MSVVDKFQCLSYESAFLIQWVRLEICNILFIFVDVLN